MSKIDGCVFEAQNLTQMAGVRHGFFTRQGGVSSGDHASLNAGYGSDDVRANVSENRRRIAHHLGASVDGAAYPDIVTCYQVHSARALIVDAPFGEAGSAQADALVTRTPGLAIGALAADCTPVLFADPVAGVIGAAHAGWRGAVAGILTSTVEAMEALGATRSDIRAAIGPTIHQAAYEVGPEFKAQFLEQAPGNASFFVKPNASARDHFDLPGYCASQLSALALSSVEDLDACTYENESLFFSFRRKTHRGEDDYGRQISAIVLA